MLKRELHTLWHAPWKFIADDFWNVQVIGLDFGKHDDDWHFDVRLLGFGVGLYWVAADK